MITFKRPDGKSAEAYLAEPVNPENAPGVVVIQEWWGLDDEIRSVADRLATAGYRALVPDLYRGKLALEANEAEHLMNDSTSEMQLVRIFVGPFSTSRQLEARKWL